MELKAGLRLRSQVCTTEVIVVRGAGERDLTCGGHPLLELSEPPGSGLTLTAGSSGGTALGKRYSDQDGGLELLVTKAGDGDLAVGTEPLSIKEATPLPSSD